MNLELRFTVPGQAPQVVPLSQSRVLVGTLLSNQVVLRAPGVDPIHALIEQDEQGNWQIIDLGSLVGVKVDGQLISVEAAISSGSQIGIGTVTVEVREHKLPALPTAPPPLPELPHPERGEKKPTKVPSRETTAAHTQPNDEQIRREVDRRDVLFSPRDARPSGDLLEVVAYWGETVLDVDHFHPSIKGYQEVTIGDPTKSHFIAAGKENFPSHRFTSISSDGYKLYLLDGMEARLRRAGKVEKVKGSASISLGRRDIAHVKYGPVRYFLVFVRPPVLELPSSGPRDPVLAGMLGLALALYCLVIPLIWMTEPAKLNDQKDDIWSIVNLPEKLTPPEKQKQEKPPVEKPKVEVAEVKKEPQVKPPPPPPPKPVEAAKPVEKEKPEQTKPVEKPVPKSDPSNRPTAALTENQNHGEKSEKKPDKADKAPGDVSKPNRQQGKEGMPSTGAQKPDMKLAGPQNNTALGAAGGPRGAGNNQAGGEIKGNKAASVMGVEGVNNNKASGVNLSQLGVGVGQVLSQTAPSAVYTPFKSSVGGAGGGMGSGAHTVGMGGVGSGHSLGLAGTSTGINNFGSGSGGLLSGQGGSGGHGGSGLGNAFGGGGAGGGGHGRANVEVPPGDPVVSGGLTAQEILAVIRAHLNEIRHCYEQLLQRSPSASGRIAVMFQVGVDGRVETVDVTDSSISDSSMRGCVTGAIRRWKFPSPRGGQAVTVNYPFVFNPL